VRIWQGGATGGISTLNHYRPRQQAPNASEGYRERSCDQYTTFTITNTYIFKLYLMTAAREQEQQHDSVHPREQQLEEEEEEEEAKNSDRQKWVVWNPQQLTLQQEYSAAEVHL
jgi:hypothetical protein